MIVSGFGPGQAASPDSGAGDDLVRSGSGSDGAPDPGSDAPVDVKLPTTNLSDEETIYIGQDEFVGSAHDKSFQGCSGDGTGDGTYRWKWRCNPGNGIIQTFARTIGAARAQASVTMGDRVYISTWCDNQQTFLDGEIVIEYDYHGLLNVNSYKGFGSEAFYLTKTQVENEWEKDVEIRTSGNDVLFPDDRVRTHRDFTGSHGDHPYPKLQVFSGANTVFDVAANSDFYDLDQARRTILIGFEFDWEDPTAPSISHSFEERPVNGWYPDPTTVEVTATDEESCVDDILWELDNEGNNRFTPGRDQSPLNVRVDDTGRHDLDVEAENFQQRDRSDSITVPIDGTPPSSSADVQCERNNEGNCVEEATVRFSCDDKRAGCQNDDTKYRVDQGSWRTGEAVTVREEGKHRVDFCGVDLLGNDQCPNHNNFNTVRFEVDCGGLTETAESIAGTCLFT